MPPKLLGTGVGNKDAAPVVEEPEINWFDFSKSRRISLRDLGIIVEESRNGRVITFNHISTNGQEYQTFQNSTIRILTEKDMLADEDVKREMKGWKSVSVDDVIHEMSKRKVMSNLQEGFLRTKFKNSYDLMGREMVLYMMHMSINRQGVATVLDFYRSVANILQNRTVDLHRVISVVQACRIIFDPINKIIKDEEVVRIVSAIMGETDNEHYDLIETYISTYKELAERVIP